MIFSSIADIHGTLKLTINPWDVLCICGDIVPTQIQKYTDESFEWMEKRFLPWVNNQPCEKVLLIGGNHDFAIYNHPERVRELFKGTKVTYLLDEEFVYTDKDGVSVKFYGSPWCHKFFNWAFMDYDDEQLKELFLKMPDDVDVLMTHDCPYGACDVLLQEDMPWKKATKGHIGSKGLAEAVVERKPKVMVTGHLHSTSKLCEKLGDTDVYNTSVKDEYYNMSFAPHYFSINADKVIELMNKEDFINSF